ncbi:hypothetical protein D3C81_1766500 [compost metagenome]
MVLSEVTPVTVELSEHSSRIFGWVLQTRQRRNSQVGLKVDFTFSHRDSSLTDPTNRTRSSSQGDGFEVTLVFRLSQLKVFFFDVQTKASIQ